MANHISGKLLREFGLKKELLSTSVFMHSFVKNGLALPEQFSNVLKMAMRGQIKISVLLI